MAIFYDLAAPKRPLNLSINQDLVAQARSLTPNLSAEVETLLGDSALAKADLGWVPQITLQEMVAEMAAADLAQARQHALLRHHGYTPSVSIE